MRSVRATASLLSGGSHAARRENGFEFKRATRYNAQPRMTIAERRAWGTGDKDPFVSGVEHSRLMPHAPCLMPLPAAPRSFGGAEEAARMIHLFS